MDRLVRDHDRHALGKAGFAPSNSFDEFGAIFAFESVGSVGSGTGFLTSRPGLAGSDVLRKIRGKGESTMISGVSGMPSLDAATKQMQSKMFSRLDTNQDGVVSQAEFDAGSPSTAAAASADQMFAAFDTDGDGQMTRPNWRPVSRR
jgi:hypothetical protein